MTLSKDINYYLAGAALIPTLAFNGLIGRGYTHQPGLDANRSYPGETCPTDPGTLNLNLEPGVNGSLYLHTRFSKVDQEYFLGLAGRLADYLGPGASPNLTDLAVLLRYTNIYEVTSDEAGGQVVKVHWIDRNKGVAVNRSQTISLADWLLLLRDPNCPINTTYEDVDAKEKWDIKIAATAVAAGIAGIVGLSALVSALRKRAEQAEQPTTASAPLPDTAPPPPPPENVSVKILPAEVLFGFTRDGLYPSAPESARLTQGMSEWLENVFYNSREKRRELRQLLRALDCALNNYNAKHGKQITLAQLAERFPGKNLGFILNSLTGKNED